ncbi:SDR family oxidoreductase [Paenibacillus frigoriresistens]|nr:SDR family oxidoreductase [Paenibacillus frigoriresistens]
MMTLALAEAGADLAVISRTKDELEKVHEEVTKLSRKCMVEALDIRDADAVRSFVKRVANEQKSIDILVNAAGITVRKKFLDLNDDDWDLIMDVNLKSCFTTSQIVIPYMQKQNKGKIINIASLTSEVAISGTAAYGASKGGVKQLTKAMAVEFAKDGIQVNGIGPGYFKTKMTESILNEESRMQWILSRTPMARTGVEGDLAGVAVFLSSAASDYITGQIIYVDGGWLANA